MQRPALRQHLRHAAALAAADGPLFRRAARLLLEAAFPAPPAGIAATDAAALTPLNAEVCVEVIIARNTNAAQGMSQRRSAFKF